MSVERLYEGLLAIVAFGFLAKIMNDLLGTFLEGQSGWIKLIITLIIPVLGIMIIYKTFKREEQAYAYGGY